MGRRQWPRPWPLAATPLSKATRWAKKISGKWPPTRCCGCPARCGLKNALDGAGSGGEVCCRFSLRYVAPGKALPGAEAHWKALLADQLGQLGRARMLGTPTAVGTGAGSVGILHGESVVEEIKLFIKAGYSLPEAIGCASEQGARFFWRGPDRRVENRRSGHLSPYQGHAAPAAEKTGLPGRRLRQRRSQRQVPKNSVKGAPGRGKEQPARSETRRQRTGAIAKQAQM